jgi:hypothetical protein
VSLALLLSASSPRNGMARGQLTFPPKMGQLIFSSIFLKWIFSKFSKLNKIKIGNGFYIYNPGLFINDVRMLQKCIY